MNSTQNYARLNNKPYLSIFKIVREKRFGEQNYHGLRSAGDVLQS